MKPWEFVADMNGDGAITISDVELWVRWLFFIPGDTVIWATIDTPLGRFFEVSMSSYGGGWSAIFSVIGWVVGAGSLVVLVRGLSAFNIDSRPVRSAQRDLRPEATQQPRTGRDYLPVPLPLTSRIVAAVYILVLVALLAYAFFALSPLQ